MITGATPIEVPPLRLREVELPRIVRAYADEALATLRASSSCFSEEDAAWVMRRGAKSLSEIEKATLRIVALSKAGKVCRAARLLGMASVSLSRWLDRRTPHLGSERQAGTP